MLIPIVPNPLTSATVQHASALSQKFALPYVESIPENVTYVLVVTENQVELQQVASKTRPIVVDFLSPAATYRRTKGGGKGQLIARAVGIKKDFRPTVLDLTAGLGEDAFVLASLGCEVHMLERSPVIAALLADGLERLHAHPEFAEFPLTMSYEDAQYYPRESRTPVRVEASARTGVRDSRGCFYDVLYLDPMFPHRTKSSLVKKEMRVLRDIVGEDMDAAIILELALKQAKKRVVVKRPRLAPTLSQQKPDLVFEGQSSRFDVYLIF